MLIRGKTGTAEHEGNEIENQTDDSNSLLIPLKQRKIDEAEKKAAVKSPQKLKQSPPLKRKLPTASSATPAKSTKQPTIQTLLKMPKGVTVTKSTTPKASLSVEKPIENKTSPATSTAVKTGTPKVKVTKITVTKAEAAVMAKDGRIKIKDGKMILNTEKL